MPDRWLQVRKPLAPKRALALKAIAFVVPIVVWCVVSYVPWVWHPQRLITDAGGSTNFEIDQRLDSGAFDEEQAALSAAKQTPMTAVRVNPIFLPAPHEVGRALYTAFATPPIRRDDPWLHQRIAHSVGLLLQAFVLAAVLAVPLGLVCGTFDLLSKLIEPFIDFMRYLPAPLFGTLAVATLGLADAPKVAVIFIGLFFNMLLVTANTTRTLDGALLEAAQTLGASKRRLMTSVILPGVLPLVYTDLRIALGFGWVYLTVAELIGAKGGLTEFLDQQGKFRHYDNVFAGIVILGTLGFATDQVLAWLGGALFPWHTRRKAGWLRSFVRRLRQPRPQSGFDTAPPHNAGPRTEAADARA